MDIAEVRAYARMRANLGSDECGRDGERHDDVLTFDPSVGLLPARSQAKLRVTYRRTFHRWMNSVYSVTLSRPRTSQTTNENEWDVQGAAGGESAPLSRHCWPSNISNYENYRCGRHLLPASLEAVLTPGIELRAEHPAVHCTNQTESCYWGRRRSRRIFESHAKL